jgi:hypothetical protein
VWHEVEHEVVVHEVSRVGLQALQVEFRENRLQLRGGERCDDGVMMV